MSRLITYALAVELFIASAPVLAEEIEPLFPEGTRCYQIELATSVIGYKKPKVLEDALRKCDDRRLKKQFDKGLKRIIIPGPVMFAQGEGDPQAHS